MPTSSSIVTLEDYVQAVSEVVDQGLDPDPTTAEVERLNHEFIAAGGEIPGKFRQLHPNAPYTRNLVHQDPDNKFAVIAIVWGPFQETSVHDHLNWCVMSVLENPCLALDYDRLDDASDPSFANLQIRQATVCPPGTVVGLTPPPSSNIHKISNTGRDTAITLHTYGDPGTKARIFEPESGMVTVRELVFHNV